MTVSFFEVFASTLGALAIWLYLRFFLAKSSLSNIPGPSSVSWFTGNFKQIFDSHGWSFHRELRESYGGICKLHGLFGSEQLYVFDPLALHCIFVKDQNVYDETEAFLVSNKLLFGKSLLSSFGEDHKRQRKMLNPVFSIKHMREMLPMLYPIAHELRDRIASDVRSGMEYVDVMAWASRAALEYIGQGGLGHSFSSLDKNKKSDPYSDALKMALLSLFRELTPWMVKFGSSEFRRRIVEWLPAGLAKEFINVVDVLETSSRNILRGKREALKRGDEAVLAQVGKGKDIMSILLKANSEAELDEAELLGHMNTFILAGHDTTTSAVSRIIHCLAQDQTAQSKLRAEITSACEKAGDLDYDSLQALPYLDAVCRETMRKYCPAPMTERVATKEVVLPLMWPIKATDGKTEIKEILVPKGTSIIASIVGANNSKAIWGEDVEEWKPSRWLEPLPESVTKARLPGVYSQMMTFIGGSRACIGFKFSEMEMKMVLSVLIKDFVFELGPSVHWDLGFVTAPFTESSTDGVPRLPLKVSLVT